MDRLPGDPARSATALIESRIFLRIRLTEVEGECCRLRELLADLDAVQEPCGLDSDGEIAAAALALARARIAREQRTYPEMAHAAIVRRPGMTGSEIAREAGIRPSRIYKVLGRMSKDGRVRRDGFAYFPVG